MSTIRRILTGTAIAAMAVGMASADNITFNTNGVLSKFTSVTSPASGLNTNTLGQTSGAAASILFTGNAGITVASPTNIDLGDFQVTCITCTNQAGGIGATFGAFTFQMEVDDTSSSPDGPGIGYFIGTSSGGTVYDDSDTIQINWSPLTLGPNMIGAASGNFVETLFSIVNFTPLVALNSGTPPGDTTVQGTVATLNGAPEPTTLVLFGSALIGLGCVRKRIRKS